MTVTATATRAEGLERLAAFVPRAGRAYATERNTDRGPHDRGNVSTLSPWVRHRLITEREVVEAVLARHSVTAAEKFVQEVYWRTYWKGWLELRPSVWQRYRADLEPAHESLSPEQLSTYEAAIAGRTGIEGFDDWARELVEVGYLHNHARMWFASIWIFTLRLPWQLGAEYFLRHLLDGDPASNTLSWRWVAGLQTVGKTYLATSENIARYTEGRFRPRGLATSAVAVEDGAPVPPAGAAPVPERLPEGRVGLLLHEDDLHPESMRSALEAAGSEVASIAALGAAQERARLPQSFTTEALADGLERAATMFGAEATALEEWGASGIVEWAQRVGVTTIVTPYSPVGPAAAALEAATRELAAHGVTIARILRPWDASAWPHARRGFFPFKERIPALLREAHITPHPS